MSWLLFQHRSHQTRYIWNRRGMFTTSDPTIENNKITYVRVTKLMQLFAVGKVPEMQPTGDNNIVHEAWTQIVQCNKAPTGFY